MHRFPFNLHSFSFLRKKWFMGKLSRVFYFKIVKKTHINVGEIKWLRRATCQDFLYNGSFQEAIGSILVLAQCFGFMPVIGVKSDSASQLRFKWNSFRTLYSFVVFLLLSVYAVMTFWILLKGGIQFNRMSKRNKSVDNIKNR